jgi:hypothetical protein
MSAVERRTEVRMLGTISVFDPEPTMAANVTDRLWSLEELVEQTSK